MRHRLVGCLLLTVLFSIGLGGSAIAAVRGIASTGSHTLVLKTDGTLWAWGYNSYGKLGLGDTANRWTNTRVTDSDWADMSTGSEHSLALKADGTLWAWGQNKFGQLGLGNTTDRHTPTQVGTEADWAMIAAGGLHSIALKTDGTLWAWGYNYQGQLGLGNSADRHTPTRVGTDADWATIAAGYQHSLALKTNGTLWAWGDNYCGQLGLGETTDRLTPTPVGTDTDWGKIAAGNAHNLATKTGGSLYAWGSNGHGQLGLGDTVSRSTPARIGAEASWTEIAVGGVHCIALKTDGTLWTWGQNGTDESGDPFRNPTYPVGPPPRSPIKVGTGATWVSVAAGAGYSLAVKADSTLWRWGKMVTGEYLNMMYTRVFKDPDLFGLGNSYVSYAGSDRYQTAILISKKSFPRGAPAVFLVKGDDFPDALAAAPLAAAYGGPVVITPSTGLTTAVTNELRRLNPATVFFIGLPDAVERDVRRALPTAAIKTIRGVDRYDTAARLAEELRARLGSVEKVVIAPGDRFPDALSAAPLAAARGWAILLTPQAGPLPQVTEDMVETLNVDKALLVGTWVAAPMAIKSLDRLVGTDRYDTCARVASYAKKHGLLFDHVAFTTGENYPDALVTAPYLVQRKGVIFLVQREAVPAKIRDVFLSNMIWGSTVDSVGLGPVVRKQIEGLY